MDVEIELSKTSTNHQGWFVLNYVHLGKRAPLRIELDDQSVRVVDSPTLTALKSTVIPMQINIDDPEVQNSSRILSDFDGDDLPVPSGHRFHERSRDAALMREGDLLVYLEDSAAGDPILASLFPLLPKR